MQFICTRAFFTDINYRSQEFVRSDFCFNIPQPMIQTHLQEWTARRADIHAVSSDSVGSREKLALLRRSVRYIQLYKSRFAW